MVAMEKEPAYELIARCYEDLCAVKTMAREIREDIDKIFDDDKNQRSEEDGTTVAIAPVSIETEQSTKDSLESAKNSSTMQTRKPSKEKNAHNPASSAAPTTTCTQVLKAFASEVGTWRKMATKQPTPGRFAAYLTDKYFIKLLKPLPDCKLVKVAKQAIAAEIEKISAMEHAGSRGRQNSIGRQSSIAPNGSRRQSIEERRKWNTQQTERSKKGKGSTYRSSVSNATGGIAAVAPQQQKQMQMMEMSHLEIPPRQFAASNQFQSVEDLIQRAEQQEDSLRNLRAQRMNA